MTAFDAAGRVPGTSSDSGCPRRAGCPASSRPPLETNVKTSELIIETGISPVSGPAHQRPTAENPALTPSVGAMAGPMHQTDVGGRQGVGQDADTDALFRQVSPLEDPCPTPLKRRAPVRAVLHQARGPHALGILRGLSRITRVGRSSLPASSRGSSSERAPQGLPAVGSPRSAGASAAPALQELQNPAAKTWIPPYLIEAARRRLAISSGFLSRNPVGLCESEEMCSSPKDTRAPTS